jgi:5-methylcytosine-specific restriction endonuclease McrA
MPDATPRHICAVETCDTRGESQGRALLCAGHAARKRKYGDPLAGPPIQVKIPCAGLQCSHGTCDRPAERGGMCGAHHQRQLAGKPLDVPIQARLTGIPYERNVGSQCSDGECEDAATRKGLCDKHYRRVRRIENGDQIRATIQAWRDRTRDERRAVFRAWEKANPEKVRMRSRSSEARRRVVIGHPDPVNYERVLAEHGMACHICSGDIPTVADLHFDHVIPLARHGRHTPSNIRPAHKICNLRKGTKLMSELTWAKGGDEAE